MAEQPEKKACLKCGHENPEAATVCEQCGTMLKPTTVPVPDIKQELAQQAQKPTIKKETGELVKQIALWVRNEPKPVLIDIGHGHVLGRRTSASDPPDLVDLTEYGAYRLGVSRRHAQFECTDDSSIVIDLGSSNGTWVNGLRLEPYQPAHVKSGDRINLGRMEFSIGYALSDAPPTAPPLETVAPTDPHLLSVSPARTGELKPSAKQAAPARPAASEATSTMGVNPPPEKGTPAQESAAKEAAEQPAAAKPAEVKPAEAKPADIKPPEAPPANIKPPEGQPPAPVPSASSPPPVLNRSPRDTKPAKPDDDSMSSEEEKKPPESGA